MDSINAKLPTFKKLIISELKEKGEIKIIKKISSIRFSSFSGGSAVDVKAVDLTKSERRLLEKVLIEYKSGSFNSYEDLYEYSKIRTRVRTAKYVSLNNHFSEITKTRVKEDLKDKFGVIDQTSAWSIFDCDFETIVWRKMCELEQI